MSRRAASRRGLASLAAVAFAVVGATGTGALAPAGAGAQAGSVELTLMDQTTWVTESDSLRVRVGVAGAPAGATIRLEVHDRLRSRSAFTETLASTDEVGPELASSPAQPLLLDPQGTMEVVFAVGDTGAGLDADEFGVYPVVVVVADAGGESLAQLVTYLLLKPEPDIYPALSVGVVMDVGAPPGLQPDGQVALDDTAMNHIGSRIGILNASGMPVSVAPVPETLDALEARGPRGQQLVQQLAQAVQGRELLARPYVDVDLDALAGAEMTNQVRAQLDAGAQTVRSWLDIEPTGGLWLEDSTMTQAAARALRDLGITRVIVPSAAVGAVPDEPNVTVPTNPVSLEDGGPVAMVADDALAVRLQGDEGRLDAQRFVAELAMIWATAQSRPRGVVVRIPADADLDTERVVLPALQGLADGQVLQATSVSQMLTDLLARQDGDPPVVDLTSDGDEAADLGRLPTALSQAQAELAGLAAMLDDNQRIRSLQRSLLIAPGRDTPDAERMAYVSRVTDEKDQLAEAVNAPEAFRITLTARKGTIPLTIDNVSDQPVMVRVRLSSSQMEFPEGAVLDLVVPPGGVRTDVEVRTRASGAFPLSVAITSPDGSVVLDRTSFTIRSTAVSGVGLVLSIGAGLFLLIWWARHWRTARRSSRLVTEHPAGRARREGALTARLD